MAVNRGACGRLRWPHQFTYVVVATPKQAVDCHIHSVSYHIVVNLGAGGCLRWPHQVTYIVVATTILRKRS
eukprot:scaffold29609_cov166-Skeletonema_marinoi.AAC.1